MRYFIACLVVLFSTSAEAHHRRHHIDAMPSVVTCDRRGCSDSFVHRNQQVSQRQVSYEGEVVSHPAGCPWVASCGCIASVRVFGHPIRELYLAANWFKYPHASPAPGMVAVRRHHVFVIESVNGDGTVVAYDGNSGGHLTRIHTVSLSGYSVHDPHGFREAHR